MKNTVRIYGKVINTWQQWEPYTFRGEERQRLVSYQYELPYKEFDQNGDLVATGSEDFSIERMNTLCVKWVYAWDGVKRNKGGKKRFDDEWEVVTYTKGTAKEVKAFYLSFKYPKAVEFDLR